MPFSCVKRMEFPLDCEFKGESTIISNLEYSKQKLIVLCASPYLCYYCSIMPMHEGRGWRETRWWLVTESLLAGSYVFANRHEEAVWLQ